MSRTLRARILWGFFALLLALGLACGGNGNGGGQVFTFDLSGGNTLQTEVAHFETIEVPNCMLVVYNLNKTSASGPLLGNIEGEVGSSGHVGWAQWNVGRNGSPSASCSNIFESQFSLGSLDYIVSGVIDRAIDPTKDSSSPVARGTGPGATEKAVLSLHMTGRSI